MRSAAIVAFTLGLLYTTDARIYGIAAPKTVAVGTTVKLEILAQDYIQSIEDVAIAFGIQSAGHTIPDSLGTLIGSRYLGPAESNIVGNITAPVVIPSGPKGKTTLTGSLFSLIGAELSPNIEIFTVNITLGDKTSTQYVSSAEG